MKASPFVSVGDRVLYVADECFRNNVPPYPTFVWEAVVLAVYPGGAADLEIAAPHGQTVHSGGVPYDPGKRPRSFHLPETDRGH